MLFAAQKGSFLSQSGSEWVIATVAWQPDSFSQNALKCEIFLFLSQIFSEAEERGYVWRLVATSVWGGADGNVLSIMCRK